MNKNLRSVAAAVALALASAWSSAQESPTGQVERFEIKAQPLSSALRAFADQTGEQVVFFSEIGKGLQAAEVVGNYTREQALQRLLNRTGLTFERLNQKTIAITDAKPKSQSASLVNKTSYNVGPIRLAQAPGTEQGRGGSAISDTPISEKGLL